MRGRPVRRPTPGFGTMERPVRILVAGFGPFPGAAVNPSAALARRLARLRRPALAPAVVRAHVFETSYRAVARDLDRLAQSYRPHVILLFGVAPRSRHLRIETRARNLVSFFPDAGRQAPSRRRIADGPPAIPVARGLPKRLLQAARSHGLRAGLSRDAGRYVCNFALWRALEHSIRTNAQPLVAFVHIPPIAPPGRRARPRPRGRPPSLERLAAAGQTVLCAMLAAFRRQARRQPN